MKPSATAPGEYPNPASALPVEAEVSYRAPITVNNTPGIELLQTLEGTNSFIFGVAFSLSGSLFGAASMDGVIRLWEPVTWQPIGEFTIKNSYYSELFFLADNARLSSDSGTVLYIATGETEHKFSDPHRVTFSPDGNWMAANGRDTLHLELWRIDGWQMEWEILTNHVGRIYSMAFSPDSQLIATGSSMGPQDTSDFTVRLWDVASGQEVLALPGHTKDIHALAFSPDGSLLASASIDTTVRVWDVRTGQLLHTLYNRDGMYDVTFSPDGSLLATAVCDRTVKLWDVTKGLQVRTLTHGGEVMTVAFSPEGSLLASGAYDGKVYLWGIPPDK